ncbi:co-chaperone DjlA [Pontiella sulfatireligans]|uniref:Co-chaperone protein DjlA n=1 Tax=Pontiella sulfatireligans TaxID=2750658 RepID=A0A6C2UTQ5_9BACT|nr:co-chaperone DjlA [Pontiella sulfatireligans]VGO22296.1 Co-chaperone protein DjlA [Pontiella sulfatireligans]
MAWTGKIIGGVLGSLLSPLGTVIGVAIGHQFDKGADRAKITAQSFQVAFFGCLAKMAQADGKITKDEINAVEQIMARFGYAGPMREAAIGIFRRAKDDPHTAADYLNQLSSVTQFNPQIAMTFIAALHAVAQADGVIHPNEREILLQAERAFRMRPGTIDALLGGGRSNTATALDNAYKVLDVSPEMTDEEIKKIYRKKCVEFHPDKLASKGLPDEFMNYANEQLAKVNEAYDIIKKARG